MVDHIAGRAVHHHHIGPQVEADEVIEGFGGDVLQRLRDVHARVVHQQVQPAEGVHRLRKEVFGSARLGKVGGKVPGARAPLLQHRHGGFDARLHVLGAGIVGEGNVIALFGQHRADASAHAERGAGYNRFFLSK